MCICTAAADTKSSSGSTNASGSPESFLNNSTIPLIAGIVGGVLALLLIIIVVVVVVIVLRKRKHAVKIYCACICTYSVALSATLVLIDLMLTKYFVVRRNKTLKFLNLN